MILYLEVPITLVSVVNGSSTSWKTGALVQALYIVA